jgi:hypothetical protein
MATIRRKATGWSQIWFIKVTLGNLPAKFRPLVDRVNCMAQMHEREHQMALLLFIRDHTEYGCAMGATAASASGAALGIAQTNVALFEAAMKTALAITNAAIDASDKTLTKYICDSYDELLKTP